MTMDRQQLLNAVTSLKPIFASGWRDHQKQLYFTENTIIAVGPMSTGIVDWECEEELTIPGMELYNFLSKNKAKEVYIDDNILKGGTSKLAYRKVTGTFNAAVALKMEPEEKKELPDNFIEAFNFVYPAIHPDKFYAAKSPR